jgi:hypothetical protein
VRSEWLATADLDYIASNDGMINMWLGKGRGLIEVLSQHLPGGTRKLRKPLRYSVSLSKFEPSISRMHV